MAIASHQHPHRELGRIRKLPARMALASAHDAKVRSLAPRMIFAVYLVAAVWFRQADTLLLLLGLVAA